MSQLESLQEEYVELREKIESLKKDASIIYKEISVLREIERNKRYEESLTDKQLAKRADNKAKLEIYNSLVMELPTEYSDDKIFKVIFEKASRYNEIEKYNHDALAFAMAGSLTIAEIIAVTYALAKDKYKQKDTATLMGISTSRVGSLVSSASKKLCHPMNGRHIKGE